ncbi:MAG: YfiH family protein [Rickettsiales bacterium]|jgi:YfiH family protein
MIKYHFFGKDCAIDKTKIDYFLVAKNIQKKNFNIKSPTIFINQIHGSEILVIDDESKIPSSKKLIDADAIVTNVKNLILAIVTADCAPIMLLDEENEVIAAVHAGWQGSLKNITDQAVDGMIKIGARLENIKAVIGPMIRQESYEVDLSFYGRFLEENSANREFFIKSPKDQHFLFDLPSYIKEKLRNKGLRNIEDDGIDTYQNDDFFSYRRNFHQRIDDEMRNISVIEILQR